MIYEVDGTNSSYLMHGSRPAYRPLSTDSGTAPTSNSWRRASSASVPRRLVKPDWNYRLKTERAVRRWSHRTNQTKDGSIDAGQVTFCRVMSASPRSCPNWAPVRRQAACSRARAAPDLVVTFDLEADRLRHPRCW